MLESIIQTTEAGTVTIASVLWCSMASLVLGFLCALLYMYKNSYSKSFVITLTLLPLLVQAIILLVNGNLGVGVAVMGAFSLVRFRSLPGSAKEITAIFLAMALGLATGTGYIVYAAILLVFASLVFLVLQRTSFGAKPDGERLLKITMPENVDYTTAYEEIFREYTTTATAQKVKSTNMGSLFEVQYRITLKDAANEKQFLDALRCRNGNLNILLSHNLDEKDVL